MPISSYIPKPSHQVLILFCAVLLSRELDEPFAEGLIQGSVLLPGLVAGQLDEVFVGAEGDILHDYSVHDVRVGFGPLLLSIVE